MGAELKDLNQQLTRRKYTQYDAKKYTAVVCARNCAFPVLKTEQLNDAMDRVERKVRQRHAVMVGKLERKRQS